MPSTPASIQSTSVLRRRGEESEHSGGVGSVFVRHLSAGTTFPLDFDIFAPLRMTMPWVKSFRTGSS